MAPSEDYSAREFNFDGIVGPTHNYAGLSYGNVASIAHKNLASNPRAAALEGLEKMKRVADLGFGQAVLPPLRRPCLSFLREIGFGGTDREVLARAGAEDSSSFAAAMSASSMWTANAATISPSADCGDGRMHISVANLTSTLHRSIEPIGTTRVLQFIFQNHRHFCVHPPLPPSPSFADEGAANHMRLASSHGRPGIECFVYGRSAVGRNEVEPRKFPARQTFEASQSISRRHQLEPQRTTFIPQNPLAIDAGVFHNDVIAVANENVLLCHELAFGDSPQSLVQLTQKFVEQCGRPLQIIQIRSDEMSLADTVKSYLFNSQLLTRSDGKMSLICPAECNEMTAAQRCLQAILAGENPIDQIEFMNLRQSMQNGGGPACLRLRVVLTPAEQAAIHQGILFCPELHAKLVRWVKKNYREQLFPDDLRDPKIVDEVHVALEELAVILQLPPDLL